MQRLLLNDNIIGNFKKIVEKNPNHTSLVYKNKQYTYRELDEISSTMANNLIRYGFSIRNVAAIYMDKSDIYVIAILAILKLGGIYLPIDYAYPSKRINNMISKSDATTLLYSLKDIDRLDNINIASKISIEDLLIKNGLTADVYKTTLPSDLAYFIFTSGSTGEPKGMGIRHEGVLNLIYSMNNVIIDNYTVTNVGMLAPMVFDMSVAQMYLALLTGRTLIIIPEDIKRDPQLLVNYIATNRIEVCDITPQHLRILVKCVAQINEKISLPNIMVSSGEKISSELVQSYFQLCQWDEVGILNSYGPSEVCVYASFNMITKKNFELNKEITIGKVICNTSLYLVNKDGNLCNVGEVGEICISGIGLTTGYIKDKQLTDIYFIDNPFDNRYRMYKTKDSGKLIDNGEIVCLGRMDNQIKHKGYRIELEEIEKVLNKFKEIDQSKVVLNGETDELIAHYQSSEEKKISDIVLYLRELLPEYMLPNRYIWHKNFCLNINGKIDQSKLSADICNERIDSIIKNKGNPKENLIENPKETQKIVDILITLIKEYLKVANINACDDLIKLGVKSLTIMNLCIDLYTHWKVEVEFHEIHQCRTIEEISILVIEKLKCKKNENKNNILNENEVVYAKKDVKALEFQKLLLKLEKRENNKRDRLKLHKYPTYNIVHEIIIKGKFDLSRLKDTIEKIVQSQTALRSYFTSNNNEVYIDYSLHIDNYFSIVYTDEVLTTNYLKSHLTDFDITNYPLFHIILFESKGEQKMMLNIHHGIFDFYSMTIFMKQLLDVYFYNSVLEVSDFSKRIAMNREDIKNEHSQFWRRYLKNRDYPAKFPSDNGVVNYKILKDDRFSTYTNWIDGDLFYNVQEFCRNHRVSEYSFYFSILKLILSKYSASKDIVIGTYTPGRATEDICTMGLFTRMVCVREMIDDSKTLVEFIEMLNRNVSNVIENYSLHYLDLYKLLEFDELMKGELFSIIINYVYQLNIKEQDIEITINEIGEEPNELPFTIKFFQESDKICIKITYATRIYSEKYIMEIANSIVSYSSIIVSGSENLTIGELILM